MSEPEPVAPPTVKDRKPGLIGCGIVHVLLGLLFIGVSVLMVVTLTLAGGSAARPAVPKGTLLYSTLLYLALAALFVVLGIGSLRARRWAPPLILVTSWGWLLTGIMGGAVMGFMLPQMFAAMPDDQPGAKAMAMGCMSIGLGLFGIALPLAFVLFYRSRHVKATVERLDPVPRWTDRQPVPLLLFACWMFFGAVSTLLSSFMYRALPIGGIVLRGWPVFAFMASMATLLFWIGVGTLRRWRSAWWAAVVLLAIGLAWGALFLTSTDPSAMYEAMGVPPDPQSAAIATAMYSSPYFYGLMGIVWIAYVAFVLYIRRYFFGPGSERPAVQPPVDL
jgi:hypothetical protein